MRRPCFFALNRAGLGAVLWRWVTYQPREGSRIWRDCGIVNKILAVFGAKFAPPGGERTSLSPETRKSTASLEELRDVLSLVKHNSAVWALVVKVVRQVQIDPGGKSKAGFLSGTMSAWVLRPALACWLDVVAEKRPAFRLIIFSGFWGAGVSLSKNIGWLMNNSWGDKRPYFGACRQPLRDSKPEASRTGRRKPRLTRFLGLAWPRKASI